MAKIRTYHSEKCGGNKVFLDEIAEEQPSEGKEDHDKVEDVPRFRKVVMSEGKHLEEHLGGENDNEEKVQIVQQEGPSLSLIVVVAHHGKLEGVWC